MNAIEFDDNDMAHVQSPFGPNYDYNMDGSSLHPFSPSRQTEEEIFLGFEDS